MFSDLADGISLPFTDDVLRFSPRFSELGIPGQPIALGLFGLVPMALVLWLYRYEMRLVKSSVAFLLLTLRVVVIALLWFVICLQPILTSTTTQHVSTRVLVALDVSGSMNATDPLQPPAAKLRLARALKLPIQGQPFIAKLLDNWIDQYEKKGENATPANIQWAAPAELSEDPDRRQKLLQGRRLLHDRIVDEVNRMTRLEISLRLLNADGGKLLKELSGKHQVDLLSFDRKLADFTTEKLDRILDLLQALKPKNGEEAWELKPDQAARLFDLNQQQLDRLVRSAQARVAKPLGRISSAEFNRLLREVEPPAKINIEGKKENLPDSGLLLSEDASATDLLLPLERSLKPSGHNQGKLIGVVLLTDGRHNSPTGPGKSAERLGKRNVPIYPVVVGSAQPRPSITLVEVQAPFNASSKNADVRVRVRFRVRGMARQDIVLSLARLEKRSGQPQDPEPLTIQHDGKTEYYDRTFTVRIDPDGKQLQTFTVALKPGIPLRAGNLSQQVVIKMDDTKAKVLVVNGEARWEFHYLATALMRDPTLEVQRVLFEPPLRDSTISDAKMRQMGNPQRKLPEGPDALADFQCIVLGDVPPEQLPLKDRGRLEEFVSKHGGTLVLVAGKRFTPLAYRNLASGGLLPAQGDRKDGKDETDPLIKLLPIESPRVVRPEQGFPVRLTRDGQTTPFMQMEAEAADSLQRWADFPPHYWAVVGKAKPAATALAYFRDPALKEIEPMPEKEAEDAEQKLARDNSLIVRHNFGRGQVLFVGLDSTWRWRYRIGDTYHHRFWGQVMRWASSDYIRFGTDKPIYQEGQPVTVDLSLEDKEIRALPKDGELKTRILRLPDASAKEEKLAALVPLSAQEGLRVLKGQVTLPAGRYKIELDKPDPSLAAKLKGKPPATFLVTPRDNKEMDHLESNEDLLRDLAQKSGADQIYTPANAGAIAEKLTDRTITRVERSERALWQEWATLIVFLVLMTAEWVGRKWAGLP